VTGKRKKRTRKSRSAPSDIRIRIKTSIGEVLVGLILMQKANGEKEKTAREIRIQIKEKR